MATKLITIGVIALNAALVEAGKRPLNFYEMQ